ncbi:MAG: SelB C-terminal domain-containing protein, partial [Acidimicrobiia bacterium]
FRVGAEGWLVGPGVLDEVRAASGAMLDAHHRKAPLEPGLELTAMASAVGLDVARLRDALEGASGIVVEHGRARLASHRPSVAGEPEAVRLLAALRAEPFAPPSPSELGARPEIVRGLVREGLLVDLDGVILAASALEAARQRLVAAMEELGSITVAQARDVLGSSRKYVLAILARLDADGVTRRRGDERFPGPRAERPA